MIRIRFHGRGGHGTKTASRIVGTAAYKAGFYAQDSPLYGAERRGAPVVAFTRFDKSPVLERGVIEQPDLIVLADETLLATPAARVLAGQSSVSAIFVNSSDGASLAERHQIRTPLVWSDLTSVTQQMLGRSSALSAGLAAAGARLTGVLTRHHLIEALKEEFAHLGLSESELAKNVAVASEVFSAIEPVVIHPRLASTTSELVQLEWDHPLQASPTVLSAGNAVNRHTGNWRVERPVIDREMCTRCGLCLVRCPDGVVALDAEGFPVIDYDHCKGCMICRQICPLEAIVSEKETSAW